MSPSPSVRSIRQRFESEADKTTATASVAASASAPSTPVKKRTSKPKQRTQTKTQVELAAFLKAGKDRTSNSSQTRSSGGSRRPSIDSSPSAPSHVSSLIEKWSSATVPPRPSDRNPLQERHIQRPDDPSHMFHGPAIDSVDTFGSSSVDLDQLIPKTDPGRLETYAAQARQLAQAHTRPGIASASQQPISGDESLKEMVTRGIGRQDGKPPPKPIVSAEHNNKMELTRDHNGAQRNKPPKHNDINHTASEKNNRNKDEVTIRNVQNHVEVFVHSTVTEVHVPSKYTTALEAKTPQPVTSLHENRTHTPSPSSGSPLIEQSNGFESSPDANPASGEFTHQEDSLQSQPVSDWGAGDIYIRELFAEAEETAERAVQCDENEEYFEAFELYWVVVDLYSKVIPFLTPAEGVDVHERIKMYTRRCEAIREAFEDDGEDDVVDAQNGLPHFPAEQAGGSDLVMRTLSNMKLTGEDTIPRNPAEKVRDLATIEGSHIQTPKKNTSAATHSKKEASRPSENPSTPKSTNRDGSPSGALRRTPYPDYPSERPLTNIPEAADPRSRPFLIGSGSHGISASTQAHRDSLSRPISRSAARASTNSVSKEKVAEMQERVNLMQECLNNFTVKQKHLGPARALELAVTTLNANTFGDLKRLEPLSPEHEHKWATELEVLLSMLKEIKVMRPGIGYALREDISKHLPALERCDRSVRKTMRSFAALAGHVRYVERETAGGSAKGGRGRRRWWVKVPVVEKGGLREEVLKIVEEAEQEMRSVFKICHEINVDVVKSIPVPVCFVESLPKHARSLIPRELKEGLTTWGMFKVSDYMKDRNMWTKEAAKEITSSLEKVALIWEARTSNKSFLSRTFDIRGERFHQAMTAFRRCQNAIRDLRREW